MTKVNYLLIHELKHTQPNSCNVSIHW